MAEVLKRGLGFSLPTHLTVVGDSDNQPRPDGNINPKQFALINKWKDITTDPYEHFHTHTHTPQLLTFIGGNEKARGPVPGSGTPDSVIVLSQCDYLGVILQRQTPPSYYTLITPKLISQAASHLKQRL